MIRATVAALAVVATLLTGGAPASADAVVPVEGNWHGGPVSFSVTTRDGASWVSITHAFGVTAFRPVKVQDSFDTCSHGSSAGPTQVCVWGTFTTERHISGVVVVDPFARTPLAGVLARRMAWQGHLPPAD